MLVARFPWHPAQFSEYSSAPVAAVGFPIGAVVGLVGFADDAEVGSELDGFVIGLNVDGWVGPVLYIGDGVGRGVFSPLASDCI